jgi:hypothetical protein
MKLLRDKSGSALLITLFILTGVLMIAVGGSNIALSGVKQSIVQYQSVRAYFAAEAGAERALWEVRKNAFDLSISTPEPDVFGEEVLDNNSSYIVNYDTFQPDIIFTSIGDFESTKRSVQVTF